MVKVMEEKLNIVEILKDKPQGTKLYDWLYNIDVELDTISTTDAETVVWCTNETDNNTTCHRGYSEFGTVRGCSDGLQILLPSKSMRDWRKFAWKKGDVLVNSSGFKLFFDRWANDDYTRFFGKVNLLEDSFSYETEKYTLASKEDTLDTLEIEKPEFKDGDIVTIMPRIGDKLIYLFKAEDDEKYYGHAFLDENIAIVNDDSYCQKDFCTARSSTEEEKQQLFDGLAKKNKAWDAEKKAIVDLKPKVEFKPFDKVLVRDSKLDNWRANLFGYIGKDGYYHCLYANWAYCIPYIGNESLLGTTKDVEG